MSIEEDILGQMAGALEVQEGLDRLSGEVRDCAKSIAPVFGDKPPHREAPEYGEPGDYRDSIKVERIPGQIDARRVISRDFKAVWIELGARHMPEYGVFAKAAKMFGGTGPTIDEGVHQAQHKLRHELETLAKLSAGVGIPGKSIAEQKRAVDQARLNRSAAFKAARGGRRGRSR